MKRRQLLVLGTGLLGCSLPALAQPAPAFPNKPVRIINIFPAGGLADAISRAVAQQLTAEWGQQVLVENRPGANGIIAAQAVLAAPNDGHTLLWANDGAISINPLLYRKLPYEPQKDFVPITAIAETVECLIISSSVPATNVRELVAYAKAHPGKLNYGSFGLGSLAHLSAETFNHTTGAGLHHIPFKGVAEVVNAMLAGEIQVLFTAQGTPLQHIQSGKMRVLAVFNRRRQPTLPNVATAHEQGLNMDARAWFGLMAAAGTSSAIIERVATSVARIARSEEFRRSTLEVPGLLAIGNTPLEFAKLLKEDMAKYAEQVRIANVRLD